MNHIEIKKFTKEKAWSSDLLSDFGEVIAKIHWTDKPYKWHVNDGREVFAVLEGQVEMKYKKDNVEQSVLLCTGDIVVFEEGDEHVAHPIGPAKILVVEKKDSV